MTARGYKEPGELPRRFYKAVDVAVIPPFTFLLAKLWALAPDAREP